MRRSRLYNKLRMYVPYDNHDQVYPSLLHSTGQYGTSSKQVSAAGTVVYYVV